MGAGLVVFGWIVGGLIGWSIADRLIDRARRRVLDRAERARNVTPRKGG